MSAIVAFGAGSLLLVVLSAWPAPRVKATASAATPSQSVATTPQYAANGDLIPPLDYREWIYLTSGLGMNYTAKPGDMENFDNVFVNREAWNSFQKTGTWPDKTMLVLESRGAQQKGSINQSGHFQTTLMGMEIHVKDEARFPGKWAFFDVESPTKATLIPATASCYSCHQQHGAVDTTFVQFYPTLLPIAEKMKTVAPKDAAGAATGAKP